MTKHYQWMIRTDFLPRICEACGRQRRLHERAQGLRGRRGADRRADDADRVLRRRLPARALDDPRRLQLEQDLRRRLRHARPPLHVLGDERRPRRRSAPDQHLDRRLPAALRLPGRPGMRRSACRRRSSTRRCGSTRRSSTRSSSSPASRACEANLAFRNLTRANMVRLATGPADGHVPEEQGRLDHEADEGADP